MILPLALLVAVLCCSCRAYHDVHSASISHILKEKMLYRDDFVKQTTLPLPHELHDVVIHTKYHNLDTLEEIVHNELTNPLSPRYRQWLSFDEVREITNNLDSNREIEAWLHPHANEIEMRWTANQHFLKLRAPVSVLESLFDTHFYHWVDNQPANLRKRRENPYVEKEVIKQAEQYSIPVHLQEHIDSVSNLCHSPLVIHHNSVTIDPKEHRSSEAKDGGEKRDSSFTALFHSLAASILPPSLHEQIIISPQIDSGATHNGYTDVAFLKAYYQIFNTQANSSHRQAVFETNEEYFSTSDLSSFQSDNNLVQQSAIDVGGYSLTDASCSLSSNDDPYRSCSEGNLDIQYIMGMAQNAMSLYWYNSGQPSGNAFNDWILDVASDAHPPWSNSISWGATEQNVPDSQKATFCNTALTLVGQGVTISVASGDNGASGTGNSEICGQSSSCVDNNGYSPSFPATCPYVTAVGATMGPEAGVPERACQSDVCYDSNYATMGGVITSGGGYSAYFDRPSWQDIAVANYSTQVRTQPASGYNTNGRGIPDISMIGVRYQTKIAGTDQWLFGTSASTPVFAAIVTLINSLRTAAGTNASSNSTALGPIGWINKNIYTADSNVTSSMFHDIVVGDNKCCSGNNCNEVECCESGFEAASGWDPVTGWGSVNYIQFAEFFETAPQQTPDSKNKIKGLSSIQQVEIYITIAVVCMVCCALPAVYFSWRRYKRKQSNRMIMAEVIRANGNHSNNTGNNTLTSPLHTSNTAYPGEYERNAHTSPHASPGSTVGATMNVHSNRLANRYGGNSGYGNNGSGGNTTQYEQTIQVSPSRMQGAMGVTIDVIPSAGNNGYGNTPVAIAQPVRGALPGSQGGYHSNNNNYNEFSKPVASNNETQCPGCGLHVDDPVRLVLHASTCSRNQPPSYDEI